MRLMLFTFFFLLVSAAFAQPGCTDWQALNFDADATENDGSCIYPQSSLMLEFVQTLPDSLNETSGLLWYENMIWTHNDGGNPSRFYGWEPGFAIEVVTDIDLGNSDWEDFADDGMMGYVLDLGNNSNGVRQDLSISQFALDDLGGSSEIIPIEEYPIAYAEQADFETIATDSTHFDCEAGIVVNERLHLFTKDWIDYNTHCYVLDVMNPEVELTSIDALDVNGLITAADIADDGTIALLGYTPFEVFIWLLWDYPEDDVFGGNKRRIELGLSLTIGQAEGLVFSNGLTGYISSERISFGGLNVAPKLWSFDLTAFTNVQENQSLGAIRLFQKGQHIYWDSPSVTSAELYDVHGRQINSELSLGFINMSDAATGTYFVVL